MGIFKKLFGRKKNEIHLSAEEAFAESKSAPFPAQPEGASGEEEAVKREKPEDATKEIDVQEQLSLHCALYQYYEKIEDAPTALRSALRSCARAVSESADRFEVTLGDQSLIALERQSLSARAKLPEALLNSAEGAPAGVRQCVLGLNQVLDITPLRKGSRFEESYRAFLDALKQQLVCYELVGETRLVRSDGKLLWSAEGTSDLKEEAQPAAAQREPENDAQEAAPSPAPQAEAQEAEAKEEISPKDRAARSRELISSHGIQPDSSYTVAIDEDHIFPRSIKETVERISALTATALIAQAYMSKSNSSPASWSAALINRYETLYGVKKTFTPKESAYLRDPGTSRHALFALKAEAAAVLMWALGYTELNWPDKSADLNEISSILKINDINLLCSKAKARDKEELLDMYDLTTRLHALCVRTGFKELKETGLDPDIIYERHYALNWLLGIGGFAAWDSIIPTT